MFEPLSGYSQKQTTQTDMHRIASYSQLYTTIRTENGACEWHLTNTPRGTNNESLIATMLVPVIPDTAHIAPLRDWGRKRSAQHSPLRA